MLWFNFEFSPLKALGRRKTLLYSIKKDFTIKYGFPPFNAVRGDNLKINYFLSLKFMSGTKLISDIV